MDNKVGIAIIIALVLLLYLCNKSQAPFVVPADKALMYNEIIRHQGLFAGQNYELIKSKIPWMDAGMYHDVKQLIRKKVPLDYNSLSIIFRSNVV